MPRRATRMPLEMPEIPVLTASMPPTGLDQVRDIMRRYEVDHFNAFVQGLEPPRPQDPLDLPPVTGSSQPLDTATLTVQQIEDMQRAVIAANERAAIIQRDAETRRHAQLRTVEAGNRFNSYMQAPRYVERERVLPRRHTALITIPQSSFQRVLRETQHTTAVSGSYRDPERGTLWGIPIRISNTGAILGPIMVVTDGIREVAMRFPEEVLLDPNQLGRFQEELGRRLDFEHERAGDEQLASTALPYGFQINRKQKVRSLIYERE